MRDDANRIFFSNAIVASHCTRRQRVVQIKSNFPLSLSLSTLVLFTAVKISIGSIEYSRVWCTFRWDYFKWSIAWQIYFLSHCRSYRLTVRMRARRRTKERHLPHGYDDSRFFSSMSIECWSGVHNRMQTSRLRSKDTVCGSWRWRWLTRYFVCCAVSWHCYLDTHVLLINFCDTSSVLCCVLKRWSTWVIVCTPPTGTVEGESERLLLHTLTSRVLWVQCAG